jgi:hypothetical protein
VLDIPQAIGMLAPRPVRLLNFANECSRQAADIYRVAGASDRIVIQQ